MYPAVAAALRAAPGAVKSLATRLGVPNSISSVLNFAKANPTTFMLAAKETFDQGVAVYDLLGEAIGEVEASASQQKIGFKPIDSVGGNVLDQLDALADEMQDIDVAIRVIGSLDELLAVRRALLMSEEHFTMYQRLKRLKGRI